MADGIDIDLTTNPWIIKFHSGAGTALPATIWPIGVPFLPKRIIWVVGTDGVAGDTVLLQHQYLTGTAKDLLEFFATGADFEPGQEWKCEKSELYGGLIVNKMTKGELFIHI